MRKRTRITIETNHVLTIHRRQVERFWHPEPDFERCADLFLQEQGTTPDERRYQLPRAGTRRAGGAVLQAIIRIVRQCARKFTPKKVGGVA